MLTALTLTFNLDQNKIKINQRAEYLGQRSSSNVIVQTHRHTHTELIALSGMTHKVVGNKKFCHRLSIQFHL